MGVSHRSIVMMYGVFRVKDVRGWLLDSILADLTSSAAEPTTCTLEVCILPVWMCIGQIPHQVHRKATTSVTITGIDNIIPLLGNFLSIAISHFCDDSGHSGTRAENDIV